MISIAFFLSIVLLIIVIYKRYWLFSILLLFIVVMVYKYGILSERELHNSTSKFQIEATTIHAYKALYVYGFKGHFQQIKKIFTYVYEDIAKRKAKRKSYFIKEKATNTTGNINTYAAQTKEAINASFCDYEFRIPKENAAPNDDENLIFKFLVAAENGEIKDIQPQYTTKKIENKQDIIRVNDSIFDIKLKEKINYNMLSKCVEQIKRTSFSSKATNRPYIIYQDNMPRININKTIEEIYLSF
ncbi:hypothetical protein [Tenacibaculum maritimum]|uniref:hypothetical protein n=3 Tax=Tenacibaculum maritimum TaxID=107401 RepID=UPI0038780C5B